MQSLATSFCAAIPYISFPDSYTTNLFIALRWVHFVAGITWVGFLYFFVLVSTPLSRQLEPAIRGKIMPPLMSRGLFWFRWASVVTVFVGIWYWMKIVVLDSINAAASPGTAIWSFFVLWTVAFLIYMGVLMSPKSFLQTTPAVLIIAFLLSAGASSAFIRMNTHGWESNRLLCIGIGGGLGWFMLFNVWGIIWRMQKRMIQWTADNAANGTPMPEKAAAFARTTLLASRTNFWLTFPMLFFMAAASHYPLFVGQ